MQRRQDAKPVTEDTKSILAPMAGEEAIVHERLASVTSAGAGEIAANSGDEHESIVGWAFQPNNEKLIQSYPSPEFLNSLSFIKKFYPLPVGAREKFPKVTHDNSCNSRHSERLAKESSLLQYKAAAKNENNLTETDHASMPLGIFASKNLAAKKFAFTLAEGATHVAHCNKFRRVAFTLAEVLITLGIIGVVAALTLPTVIQKYQKQVTVTKLKKAYSVLGQIAQKSLADNDVVNFSEGTVATQESVKEFFDTYWLPYFNGANVDTSPSGPWQGSNIAYKYKNGNTYNISIYTRYSAGRILFSTTDGVSYFIIIIRWRDIANGDWTPIFNPKQEVIVDVNGIKPPNVLGKDIFRFWIDFKDGIVRADGYNKSTSEINSSCNTSGIACAAKIMQDGWKITYPW